MGAELADVRHHLVHEVLFRQLRAAGRVPGGRLGEVFLATPRGAFLPDEADASEDVDVDLPRTAGAPPCTATAPSVVLAILDQLTLDPDARVLELGTGSGYQAALMSQLAREVVTVEVDREVAQAAARRLALAGASNVSVMVGDGQAALPDRGPYDAILIAGAVRAIAPEWVGQLRDGGTLVAPLAVSVEPPWPLGVFRREGSALVGHFVDGFTMDGLRGLLSPRQVHLSRAGRWVARAHTDIPAALFASTPTVRSVGTWRVRELSGLKLCTELLWRHGLVVSGVPEALPYSLVVPGPVGHLGWSCGIAGHGSAALWTSFGEPVSALDPEDLCPVVIRGYGAQAEVLASSLEEIATTWKATGCAPRAELRCRWTKLEGWRVEPRPGP